VDPEYLWADYPESNKEEGRKFARIALESILPIADGQVKDAERIDALERLLLVDANRRMGGPFKYQGSKLIFDVAGESLREAIDRAIASAKGDAR